MGLERARCIVVLTSLLAIRLHRIHVAVLPPSGARQDRAPWTSTQRFESQNAGSAALASGATYDMDGETR